MKKYGLIGKKLGHSFSPQIHKALGGYDYELIELSEDELEGFFRGRDFDGVNVTVPYKKAVIPFLDELSETAKILGSVNTVLHRADGSLYGDNTDLFGFESMVKKHKLNIGGKALVLGNGGVSPTVCHALKRLGAEDIVVVSRSGENNYDNLARHYDADVIVNTTPVGMYPNNGERLIPLEKFRSCRTLVDVVYNPLKTQLVLDAETLGIKACGGLYMLSSQAARACELFTGKSIPSERLDEVYISILNSVRSIVLIGMPGCGKTSTAKALGKLLSREIIDCDEVISGRIGMSIPEYFEARGVENFRSLETEVLRDISRKSGAIISCGGGVVMREENRDLIKQNGVIVFIERDLSELSTDGRPLSQANSVYKLAEMRLPLYNKWCDFKVSGESPEAVAEKIKEKLKL